MKKLLQFGEKLIIGTGVYWLTYTLWFIYRYGWHIEAINDLEKTLDTLATIGFNLGAIAMMVPMGLHVRNQIIHGTIIRVKVERKEEDGEG